MKRLFVGLPLPPEVTDALVQSRAALLPNLNRARPIRSAQMHITLAFLGDTPAEEIPRLCEDLDALRRRPPILAQTAAWGCFSRRKPLLWVGVEPTDAFSALASEVRRRIGLRPERFTPHITLVRDAAPVPAVFPPMPAVSWTVDTVCLFESVSTPRGMRYDPLHTLRLQGDPL